MTPTCSSWTSLWPEAWKALKQAAGELSAARGKACQGLRPGDSETAQTVGIGRLAADRGGRNPRAGRRSFGLGSVWNRAPTASRCCSRRIPAKSLGRCARSRREASCLDSRSRPRPCSRPSIASPRSFSTRSTAGVGGRLGSALGKALAELARHHQVICVTHLPQMASYAHHQWVIRKRIERGRSRTTITPLGEAERIEELAAMLRGDSAAEGTRQEAMAMLLEAQATR